MVRDLVLLVVAVALVEVQVAKTQGVLPAALLHPDKEVTAVWVEELAEQIVEILMLLAVEEQDRLEVQVTPVETVEME
jgi:hypothetical protein